MLVSAVGVMIEKTPNEIPNEINKHSQIEKVELYYNIDDPNTAYIKNSDGEYDEVVING